MRGTGTVVPRLERPILAHVEGTLAEGLVAIARALINSLTLLLADEPTGNLNSEVGDAVLDILTSLHENEGMLVVMVTHDARIAGLAERQVLL